MIDGFKQVVASMSPMEEMGLYWGYRVRYASNLSSVFNGSPFKVEKMHTFSFFPKKIFKTLKHSPVCFSRVSFVGWI